MLELSVSFSIDRVTFSEASNPLPVKVMMLLVAVAVAVKVPAVAALAIERYVIAKRLQSISVAIAVLCCWVIGFCFLDSTLPKNG